jgi:hypothetical protein
MGGGAADQVGAEVTDGASVPEGGAEPLRDGSGNDGCDVEVGVVGLGRATHACTKSDAATAMATICLALCGDIEMRSQPLPVSTSERRAPAPSRCRAG